MNFITFYGNFTKNLQSRSLVLFGVFSWKKVSRFCIPCFQLGIGECQCTHAGWEHSDISSWRVGNGTSFVLCAILSFMKKLVEVHAWVKSILSE